VTNAIRTLVDSYRPELHYMRGPGPKWHAKHDFTLASLDDAIGGSRNDNKRCAPRQHLPSPMFASSYRPMPTPSTKNADAVRDVNDEARRNASLSVNRVGRMIRQNFKNRSNTTVATICAGVLSVVFLLSITNSLIVSSSLSANAEPPGKRCVAVSEGEYQGAYRKNLLLTRFGAYVKTGRLGPYDYWYCR
jgi:hypothetical protein